MSFLLGEIKCTIKNKEFFPTDSYRVYKNERHDGYGGVFITANKKCKTSRVTKIYDKCEYVTIKQRAVIIKAGCRPPYNRVDHFD